MPKYPRKDKRARTGSNIRSQPLLAHRRKELAREGELHEQLARKHHGQSRKLFSKADLRLAAKITNQVTSEWRQASVKLGGDSARLDALKLSARKKLQRLLGQRIGKYRESQAMRRAHLREHRKLTTTTLASIPAAASHLAWGDITTTLTAGQEFTPPFTVFDVQTIENGHFIVYNESFALPEIGHLVNNIVFDQNESTSFSDGLWGLLRIAVAENRASCGVAFTTPSAGRLRVNGVMQNFYNKVMFSVHDKFGFSSADVDIFLRLFVAVVRGTRVIFLPTVVSSTGLISHGSDLSYSVSDLDDSVPYTVTGVTSERFNANESVLVLAGSEVHIQAVLDDMHCKVNAVLWWQLKKLTIEVFEDVIT